MSYLANPGDNLTAQQQTILNTFIALATTPAGYHLAKDATGNFVNTADTGSSTTAGGSNTQLQYNNSTALGGIPGATYNGTKLNILSSTLELSDNTDPTKKTVLALNAITTGTTVILTVPNQSGTIALVSDIPKINQVLDTNGNKILTFTTTAGAVNYIDIKDAATGTNPTFTASGTDANIGFNFVTKGSGTVTINGSTVALDSNVVHLTGNESISGSKTFSNLAILGAGFNTYFGNFSGGNPVGGTSLNQLILEYNGGGYKHFVLSQHNAGVGSNQIRFFLNNSATSGGSTSAGTGNTEIMTLDDAAGVQIYKSLSVDTGSRNIKFRDNAIEETKSNYYDELAISYAGYNNGYTQFRDLGVYNGKGQLITKFIGNGLSQETEGSITTKAGDFFAKYGTVDKNIIRGTSGVGGRASQHDMIATHTSDNTRIRFTWYADRDGAVVGNDTLQLWAYPTDNAGAILDFAQVMTLHYDRATQRTTFDMQRDKQWDTYTPTITADSGSVSSYATQSGYYKKIGSTVHFRFRVEVSNWGSASGGFNIGLPIAAHSNSRNDIPLAGFACDVGSNPATANKGMPVIDGAGHISFLTAVSASRLTVGGVTTNTVFHVSGTYEV